MTITPFFAKQIRYIDYNEQSEELTIYFHQGHIQAFRDINEEKYRLLLKSTNPYDDLIELTQLSHIEKQQ